MSQIPEDAKTVTAEGNDIKAALAVAAEALGVAARDVGYKLDLSHFRNATGGSVPRTTVKVVAWHQPAPEGAAEEPAAESAPAEAAPAAEERKPRTPDEGLEDTDASAFSAEWFTGLLGLMGLEGTAVAKGDDTRVQVVVNVDKAGRLIGRRGSTLSAVRHLHKIALKDKFGELELDVEVDDPRGSERPRRGRDRDRDDRRGGRDRKERRGGRDRRDRRGRDGDRRDRRGGSSEYSDEKLQLLAQKAAAKAIESGKAITIKREFNSYARRIIHMTVADEEGVESRSIEKDGVKYVQVAPA